MLLVIGAGGHAQGNGNGGIAALAALERGQWELKAPAGGTSQRLCLTNPAALIQIRHPHLPCTQVVMVDTPELATVRYACPGHGHGRTTISVETPRLVRVETQGIVDGSPFVEEYEGRRMGGCG
ncbi:MAG: hypothetical protein WDN24_00500 [Sphingomonas sp.]